MLEYITACSQAFYFARHLTDSFLVSLRAHEPGTTSPAPDALITRSCTYLAAPKLTVIGRSLGTSILEGWPRAHRSDYVQRCDGGL